MTALVEIHRLFKDYPLKTGLLSGLINKSAAAHAISGVDLQIGAGEIVGIVGESGSGKTTLGKILVQLEPATSGEIIIGGKAIGGHIGNQARRDFRRGVQMIFQDPYDTLNPRQSIIDSVTQALRFLHIGENASERRALGLQAMELVELNPAAEFAARLPHQLSGGQRQRVAIARALIVQPKFLVADEPVSMLDVSIRAGILNLLKRLNAEFGIAMMLITHDLTTAYYLSKRIAVMYLGRIVEIAPTERLLRAPRHPYTQLLLASAPDLHRPHAERPAIPERAADATKRSIGCPFAPRCPFSTDACRATQPDLVPVDDGHSAACIRLSELSKH